MTTKAIFVVGGAICLCLGLAMADLKKKEVIEENSTSKTLEIEGKEE